MYSNHTRILAITLYILKSKVPVDEALFFLTLQVLKKDVEKLGELLQVVDLIVVGFENALFE